MYAFLNSPFHATCVIGPVVSTLYTNNITRGAKIIKLLVMYLLLKSQFLPPSWLQIFSSKRFYACRYFTLATNTKYHIRMKHEIQLLFFYFSVRFIHRTGTKPYTDIINRAINTEKAIKFGVIKLPCNTYKTYLPGHPTEVLGKKICLVTRTQQSIKTSWNVPARVTRKTLHEQYAVPDYYW